MNYLIKVENFNYFMYLYAHRYIYIYKGKFFLMWTNGGIKK